MKIYSKIHLIYNNLTHDYYVHSSLFDLSSFQEHEREQCQQNFIECSKLFALKNMYAKKWHTSIQYLQWSVYININPETLNATIYFCDLYYPKEIIDTLNNATARSRSNESIASIDSMEDITDILFDEFC